MINSNNTYKEKKQNNHKKSLTLKVYCSMVIMCPLKCFTKYIRRECDCFNCSVTSLNVFKVLRSTESLRFKRFIALSNLSGSSFNGAPCFNLTSPNLISSSISLGVRSVCTRWPRFCATFIWSLSSFNLMDFFVCVSV